MVYENVSFGWHFFVGGECSLIWNTFARNVQYFLGGVSFSNSLRLSGTRSSGHNTETKKGGQCASLFCFGLV